MYQEYGITQEEYENILNEYGDVNYYTINEYFSKLSSDLSNGIKNEVFEYKKDSTEFMDRTKYLFFLGLLAGYGYVKFSQRLDKEYADYQEDIKKQEQKGFKFVLDLTKQDLSDEDIKEQEKSFTEQINELLSKFSLDTTSTKSADDKYIKLIKNYYKKMEKTTEYYKTDITLKEYLARQVDKFDKLEKTVAYYNKDGTIRAYFDIASYDSMVYNTNLTRTGVRESIKASLRLNQDVVYVDPHPFACLECQIWQGKFYSLTGKTNVYNGERVLPLEMALEGESGIGLLHPNCTHILRPANYEDRLSNKYSSEEWEEKYNLRQKEQSLMLKRSRLKNDNKIYKELDDQSSIDENNKKIRSLNEKIRVVREQME